MDFLANLKYTCMVYWATHYIIKQIKHHKQ